MRSPLKDTVVTKHHNMHTDDLQVPWNWDIQQTTLQPATTDIRTSKPGKNIPVRGCGTRRRPPECRQQTAARQHSIGLPLQQRTTPSRGFGLDDDMTNKVELPTDYVCCYWPTVIHIISSLDYSDDEMLLQHFHHARLPPVSGTFTVLENALLFYAATRGIAYTFLCKPNRTFSLSLREKNTENRSEAFGSISLQ